MARRGGKAQNKRKRSGIEIPERGETYDNGEYTKAEKARRKSRATREQEEETLSVVIAQRRQKLNLSESLAANQMAPIVAWRWSKKHKDDPCYIQEHQKIAATAFHRLYWDYLKAIRCPGLPNTPEGDRKRGGSPDIDGTDPAYVERCISVIGSWDSLSGELKQMSSAHFVAARDIAAENIEHEELAGQFREAMNVVHERLIGPVDKRGAA